MDRPSTMKRVRRLADRAQRLLPVQVVVKFIEDNAGSQAVLIAWNALTATLPIALALAATSGAVLSLAGVSSNAIYDVIIKVFPADVGAQQAALDAVTVLRNRSGIFAIIAVLGFLWTASNLFGAMEQAFSVVYVTKGRPFVRQKLMALVMMAVFAALALLAIAASTVQALIEQIPGLPEVRLPNGAGQGGQVLIGAIAGFLLFFAVYYVVPNRHHPAGRVLPGAILAGIMFEGLTQLFPAYIRLNSGINQYGRSFAFLFILLAFFYFLGVITMLGAEVNAVIERRHEQRRSEHLPPPPSGEIRSVRSVRKAAQS
jgi:membrane protein